MKKKRIIVSLLLVILVLTGCNQKPTVTNEKVSDDKIVQSNKGSFKMELPIANSAIKGYTTDMEAFIDFDDMEQELLTISQKFLNLNDVIYEPGQIISLDEARTLLGRQSDDNSQGLNPAMGKNPKDTPIYANTIVEQDFFKYDEKGKRKYDTISLGVGINTLYNYSEIKDPVKITDDEIINYITPDLATKLTKFIRAKEGMEEVNIIFAMYKEDNDGILPGNYLTYGEIKKDSSKIEKIERNNTSYKIFPNSSTGDEEVNTEIAAFQKKISTYFTDYSSLTAIGRFENGSLDNLKLNITINNYSTAEIEVFLEYIESNIGGLKNLVPNISVIVTASGETPVALLTYENGNMNNKYIY